MRRRTVLLTASVAAVGTLGAPAESHPRTIGNLLAAMPWPQLWLAYRSRFINNQGRVIDYSANDGFTTSEGQAYALFFSLVANDQALFRLILGWTNANLANGALGARLPAWKWGKGSDGWGVLDNNSASDADSWLAYSLVCAGRRWNDDTLFDMGAKLATLIIAVETASIGKLRFLLPGAWYFPRHQPWVINPSYTPLFLAEGLAHATQSAGWRKIATSFPTLLARITSGGFAPDWAWWPHQPKVLPSPMPVTGIGSYDAIRTYLWAGMTPTVISGAAEILSVLYGMDRRRSVPFERVDLITLSGTGDGGPGFSGALLPYLARLHRKAALRRQLFRIRDALGPQLRLLGNDMYYPENLILFGLGSVSGQIKFASNGMLLE